MKNEKNMDFATLSDEQLMQVKNTEGTINTNNNKEIILLAYSK